jgi:hypothetical protein
MLRNLLWNFSICSEHLSVRLARQRMSGQFRRVIVGGLLFASLCLSAQDAPQLSPGIAWRVSGAWHVEGEGGLISTGDAVAPRSILRAAEGSGEHSVTVLLPDGQRVLYECFAPQDCARGFRVPSLYRKPEPIAVDLLARVHAVSRQTQRDHETASSRQEISIARDEVIAALGQDNKAEIGGLAAALSNGSYWYEVRPSSASAPAQKRQEFQKTSRSISLDLPSEGLFDVLITDRLNTPRIDLLVGAVRPPRSANLIKSFAEVQALLRDWNEDYQGWPVHDFQRNYLQSELLGIQPAPPDRSKTTNETAFENVTAEPIFTPMPGVFPGDTEVTLKCQTPGATMHYTVDGSQPGGESAIFRAPIMVKGTELTIKAFASAQGKRDSPVVTGIFRIGN